MTEEGLDVNRQQAAMLYFLWEGDGLAEMGKSKQAAELYEAQIIILRSQPDLNIKALAMTHNRLGKLFLKLERFERRSGACEHVKRTLPFYHCPALLNSIGKCHSPKKSTIQWKKRMPTSD